MKYLIPIGGVSDDAFGILATYRHKGIPLGIRSGLSWAADNCAFGGNFDGQRYLTWLRSMQEWRANCLFVTVPDVVADSAATLALWQQWRFRFDAWPLAFVCQDGQQPQEIPSEAAVLFIGGSTDWKMSAAAEACIRWGQGRGQRIHIGRINWGKRYDHFRLMQGSEDFTTDGTRTRFEGSRKTLKAWKEYMSRQPLLQLSVTI